MASGEQVALQPALAVVLGEHLHDPALGADVLVRGAGVDEASVLDLEHGPEPVGVGLVGAEEPEVPPRRVSREGVPEELAQATGGLGSGRAG